MYDVLASHGPCRFCHATDIRENVETTGVGHVPKAACKLGMKHHRTIWVFAVLMALLAIVVVAVRRRAVEDLSPMPPQEAELVRRMLPLLEADPTGYRPETKVAVIAVAELGEGKTAEIDYARALLLYWEDRFDAAEAAFREAIDRRPGWSWPYDGLGVMLSRRAKNRRDEAEQLLRKAISLDPQWSRAYNDLGILYRKEDRLDESMKEARIALELAPDNVSTNNNYANLLVALDRMDEAEMYYERALELEPSHPAPYYNLACFYSIRGELDEALLHLRYAIRLDPVYRDDARIDPDLDPLRDLPEFQALVNPEPLAPPSDGMQ